MTLTQAQLTALKTAILADGTLAPLFTGDPDKAVTIAAAFNLAASGPFFVWRTSVAVDDVYDQMTWANYTPNDSPPASTNTVTGTNDALLYNNRALLCEIKQLNLQLMLVGRSTFNASKSNLRTGLQDATLNIPSGAAGANRSAGWASILLIISRAATRAEKLFANTTAGTGAVQAIGATGPATLTVEGNLTGSDVVLAKENG